MELELIPIRIRQTDAESDPTRIRIPNIAIFILFTMCQERLSSNHRIRRGDSLIFGAEKKKSEYVYISIHICILHIYVGGGGPAGGPLLGPQAGGPCGRHDGQGSGRQPEVQDELCCLLSPHVGGPRQRDRSRPGWQVSDANGKLFTFVKLCLSFSSSSFFITLFPFFDHFLERIRI